MSSPSSNKGSWSSWLTEDYNGGYVQHDGLPMDNIPRQAQQSYNPPQSPIHHVQEYHTHSLPLGPLALDPLLLDPLPLQDNALSLIGTEGMPLPRPRPKKPYLNFTTEDDNLIIDLKEQKNLKWEEIGNFFPGRSSRTLQVRYCTSLKDRDGPWTDEMTDKLQIAISECKSQMWLYIAQKLGPEFTAEACESKARLLESHLKCERINPSTNKPCNGTFSSRGTLHRHERNIHKIGIKKKRPSVLSIPRDIL